MTFRSRVQLCGRVCLVLLLGAFGSVQAGEIILGTGERTATPSSRSSAAEQRERARSQRDDVPLVPVPSVVVDDEDGPYGARPGGAADSRNRARMYQKGNDGPAPGELERALGLEADTPRNRAASSLDKARAYQRGDSPALGAMPRSGSGEKLPLVDCSQTESVSARIGDDNVSGSIITLFRDGKGVRVRCK